MVRSRRTLQALIFLAVIAVAGWGVYQYASFEHESGNPSRDGSAAPTEVRKVTVAMVQQEPIERFVEAIGVMHPLEEVTIKVKVAGRLTEVLVDLGDEVPQGQVVALVEQEDYDLEVRLASAQVDQALALLGLFSGSQGLEDLEELSMVRQARATLQEAERHLRRLQQLSQPGAISEAERDNAEVAVELASGKLEDALQEGRHRVATLTERRTALAIAERDLSETLLRAPFEGAVTRRWADAGEYLHIGEPVLSLVRTDRLRLRLEVPERLAPYVQLGQSVRFQVDHQGEVFEARVERLSPVIEPGSRILTVESQVAGAEGLRPGSFVRGQIVIDAEDPVLTLPASALVSFAGVHRVFVVQDGRAVEREVSPGQRVGSRVEVSGLDSGELVVLEPGNLRGGAEVSFSAPTAARMAGVHEG
ncbi:MAG: efflux RND transporter periplasmic adaptor subunit [Planctomycetaceae bacterium]|nr:MAG: efflux RND transporter periplasmic adaptor subunit [Planctomycetaceae bacterium]